MDGDAGIISAGKRRSGKAIAWMAACMLSVAGGCAVPQEPPAAEPPAPITAPAPLVGGDRDEHGCIPSAGYRWCERTGQCERPWELAQAQGFENSTEAFERHCRVPAPSGG
ncbi:hypothetical protein [Pseudoxanthomonas suwonensis]|uniref:Uncharacterized protein n=1 Tax=Pseudoxanthomonas suwonensis TaxID=314722 RepID=A0A0E3Z1B4_9GAMM|nr:hypothetical protein [Pseudoxanthomonas suwonensis]AKC86669.1 hypothetical protein WQ53_07735 [Pseudoxanthomonas suwonensis]